MVLHFLPNVIRSLLILGLLFSHLAVAQAENVAPGAHWGAIDFPDRDHTLMAGFTSNRFTEFSGGGARFNAVTESAGFNFATVSWTDRIKALPGWSGNLTIGVGPTGESPSDTLQNNFLHHASNQNPVPVGETRAGWDAMVGGSLTRWGRLFSERDTGFAGMGIAGGSLYQEVYGRIGLRQLSLAEFVAWMLPGTEPEFLNDVSRFVRFSAMGRFGLLYGGSAYPGDVIASQSYLGQASVSFADYGVGEGTAPRWELEVALTYDSGLFASPNGGGVTRRFGSLALRFPYGTVETWNDFIGQTDSGPTYGFSIMLNVLQLYPLFADR